MLKKVFGFFLRRMPRGLLQRIGIPAMKVIAVFYSGTGVECVICKKSFRKFLPYGRLDPRDNALCPNCLSLERHRLIWLYLKEKTNFFQAALKVLHVAPEKCFSRKFEKQQNLEYISADIESPWAKVKMDIRNMPFENNFFDVILCNHVLEHIDDDTKAIRELRRVLQPGGFAIMQPFIDLGLEHTYENPEAITPAGREKHFRQSDHWRIYGRDYKERLERLGFKVSVDHFVKTLGGEAIRRYGLNESEDIYFCTCGLFTK